MRYASVVLSAILLIGFALALAQKISPGAHPESPHLILQSVHDSLGYYFRGTTGWATFKHHDSICFRDLSPSESLLVFSPLDSMLIKHGLDSQTNVLVVSGKDTAYMLVYWDTSNPEEKYDLLRKYDRFGDTPPDTSFNFYYSPPDDSNLAKLRIEFNLDSVAGYGNEADRVINLLRWAHSIVKHDGNSINPSPANAFNIIKVCRDEHRGVNCRMMATILNEAYLAMGFKSRHLTCFPYDKNDQDCHVVDMVYSYSLRKWILMDPTFNAYFKDSSGNLLGPMEIRAKLISGEELVINDGINWNGQPAIKEKHMNYMAKNLFRFMCPSHSEFGYESNPDNVKWVYLNPIGYDSEKTGRTNSKGDRGQLVEYFTDNSDFFWAKPH